MYIYIISFGDVEKKLLLSCACTVKQTLGFEVRISSVNFTIGQAYNSNRRQYHAELVLNYLSKLHYSDLLKLVALVSFDLYMDGLNFVFGLAQYGGRNAVVSTYRLRTSDEWFFFSRGLRRSSFMN